MLAVGRADRLDREVIATRTRDRFSLDRMITSYEEAFRTVLEQRRTSTIPHLLPSGWQPADPPDPAAASVTAAG